MSHRIDVELTSVREDGSWTWRAAGARQPKGVLEGSVLYEGAKVGDVVRAEADFELEGITILSVLPPREKKRSEPERLEIIGTPSRQEGVTSSLVRRSGRQERGGRDGDGSRRRQQRRDGDGPTGERPRRDRATRQSRSGREAGAAGRRGDGPRESADGRHEGARRSARRDAEASGRASGRPARQRDESGETATRSPRAKRLSPANVHRDAALAALSPEQRPIAEQVLKGGIPAVRQAIEAQNERARSASLPEVNGEALVAMAEELLPALKAAAWRDRAEAAAASIDEIGLRDLRSVVAGADTATRDDDSRLLASTLREALERRVEQLREQWVGEITRALDEGRLVRALRVSAHPPEPTARFPADLAVRMSEAAGQAMAPDTSSERWTTLLSAVAESPVRRMVKPQGLPRDPADSVIEAARQASGRVPALASLLGIEMPPPPGPPRPHSPRPPRHPVGHDRRAG